MAIEFAEHFPLRDDINLYPKLKLKKFQKYGFHKMIDLGLKIKVTKKFPLETLQLFPLCKPLVQRILEWENQNKTLGI